MLQLIMSKTDDISYSQRVIEINSILQQMENCEDVEIAIELFEKASEHIKSCNNKIEKAKGKYLEVAGTDGEYR